MSEIEHNQSQEEKKKTDMTWPVIAIIVIVAYYSRPWLEKISQESNTPMQVSSSSTTQSEKIKSVLAANTRAYWDSNVVPLHHYRFLYPAGNKPFDEHDLKFISGYMETVNRIRITSETMTNKENAIRSPDPELVEMVKKHLEIDRECLLLISKLMDKLLEGPFPKMNDPNNNATNKRSIQNYDWDYSKLDEEQIAILNKVYGLGHKQMQQLHETKLMQSILRKRYPGTDFSLPEEH